MGRARYDAADFLRAALGIAAERGPLAVTVGSITEDLKASTGSFYHRFVSRDVLLAELWVRLAADFQRGIGTALEGGDALQAALHAPAFARAHPEEARLLLLHHRDEFIQGELPAAAREAAATQIKRQQAAVAAFAGLAFGCTAPDAIRRAQFLLSEVPVAAIGQHLRRREPPPPIVDELIATTYHAVVTADRRRSHDNSSGPGS